MADADITFRWKASPAVSEYTQNRKRVIVRARLQYGVRRGQPVTLRLTAVPAYWAGIDAGLSVWTISVPPASQADPPPLEPTKEEGSECSLKVRAAAVERLSVYSRPAPGPDGRVRTCIVPADRFGNPSELANPVPVQLHWGGRDWTETLRQTLVLFLDPPRAAVSRLKVAVPMESLGAQENVANGVRDHGRLVVIGNPVWSPGVEERMPAFGEFHWHTDISGDGQRPIEEAVRCARDSLNMDYVSSGDHNPQGEDWQRTVRAMDAANEHGVFATFYGWENGTDIGHENYYFLDAEHPLICGGTAGVTRDRPATVVPRLSELQRTHDFIAIPHHTNAVAETRKPEDDSPYWHPYPWGAAVDYVRLVEIMQCRGNQERDVTDDAWRGWYQNNHASVQDALALGYKIGFTGGTDNHCGWPGRAFAECELAVGGNADPKSVILTGVWTTALERRAVYEGLKARHTWAVWDTRALVVFSVNGCLCGGEIRVGKGMPLNARIRMSAEDALQTVEIVSEKRTVWQASFVEQDIELEIPLGAAERSTHFYLRARERTGGLIYASPVFVTVL